SKPATGTPRKRSGSILISVSRCCRSKSQVDAFTCFGRILNLLEELLLPDRIVECRNGLCSTGQISAQRHIQVAEFRYACLQAGPWEPLVLRRDREILQGPAIPLCPSD